jgi:hypothetical protein
MKTCVKWFVKDGLEFIPGMEYKVEFNPIDKNLYIYTVWGFTTITASQLSTHFI